MIYIAMCNYNAGNKLRDSLESIKAQTSLDKAKIWLIDNGSRDNPQEIIKDYPFVNSIILEKNIGKAAALNLLVSKIPDITRYDILMNLDSDIVLTKPDFLDSVIRIWNTAKTKVACLVCFQTGNSLFVRKFAWTSSASGDFHYFCPSEGYGKGIAGAGIIMEYESWTKVGGYVTNCAINETSPIYSTDDGFLMVKLWRATGMPICVVKELEIYHPSEDNKDYQNWKNRIHQEVIKHGKVLTTSGFFD